MQNVYTAPKLSTGIPWFYWEYYRDLKDLMGANSNLPNYTEYTPAQLFVHPKYHNYKEESLSHLSMKKYNLAIIKAKEHMSTYMIKAMTCTGLNFAAEPCGIAVGSILSINHVISVILYTDYSDYCSDFSSSFRKLSATESFQSVKKRNATYWFQSKYFRESVECYGTSGRNELFDEAMKYNIKGFRDIIGNIGTQRATDNGPFYTGICQPLILPEFALNIFNPTSTSKDIEVSINFASRDGMILQLSRDITSGHGNHTYLTNFDCSWLSRYPGIASVDLLR